MTLRFFALRGNWSIYNHVDAVCHSWPFFVSLWIIVLPRWGRWILFFGRSAWDQSWDFCRDWYWFFLNFPYSSRSSIFENQVSMILCWIPKRGHRRDACTLWYHVLSTYDSCSIYFCCKIEELICPSKGSKVCLVLCRWFKMFGLNNRVNVDILFCLTNDKFVEVFGKHFLLSWLPDFSSRYVWS